MDAFQHRQGFLQSEEHQLQQRPTSVPPQTKPGSRSRRNKHNLQDGPFILEPFSFPEQQVWLKVKPRHRKAGVAIEVPAESIAENLSAPSSEAPDTGETLSLDKHADRIAALIAQKRKENEFKLFRERMSLQQRLHRGEADDQDQLIAASHDELKRKMKLSAKGIFEEAPPNGEPVVFGLPDTPMAQVSARGDTERSETATSPHEDETVGQNPMQNSVFTLQGLPVDDATSMGDETDTSDLEEEITSPNIVEPIVPSHGTSALSQPLAYLPYNSNSPTVYQSRTTVTTQTLAFTPSQYQRHAQVQTQAPTLRHFFAQPRFSAQRYSNPQLWQPAPEPGPSVSATGQLQTHSQDPQWTTQMFKALPSTNTPMLETRDITMSDMYAPPDSPSTQPLPTLAESLNLFGASSTSATNSAFTVPTNNTDGQGSSLLRSNVNMFTRQARENGVIGGNNNYLEELGLEGSRRRNKFASRA